MTTGILARAKDVGVKTKKKFIPPLKDIPDEIYADSSGEDQEMRLKKLDLETSIRQIMAELGLNNFHILAKAYRLIGVHDPVKER